MTTPATVQLPPELEKQQSLIVRQARALIVSSDADYKEARAFREEVILAGKQAVRDVLDPHIAAANKLHKGLTAERNKHLEPWEQADKIVVAILAKYADERKKRLEAERQEAERQAREAEKQRLEAEAAEEKRRAEAEAERRRAEAERIRLEAEAAGNTAQAERAQELEAEAAAIAESGERAAAAILAEPIDVIAPTPTDEKLSGTATLWKCDREHFDMVALVKWVAENPADRIQYLLGPAWPPLDTLAKAQREKFRVPGITARPVTSIRSGGRS